MTRLRKVIHRLCCEYYHVRTVFFRLSTTPASRIATQKAAQAFYAFLCSDTDLLCIFQSRASRDGSEIVTQVGTNQHWSQNHQILIPKQVRSVVVSSLQSFLFPTSH